MKFFVDTTDIKEIKDLAATGMVDGVTTNPSLIAKSGRPIKESGGRIPVAGRTYKTNLPIGRLALTRELSATVSPLSPSERKMMPK